RRSKELAVAPGNLATFCVPLPQALELDGQDPCLDRVESAIVPLDVVNVFPRLAMISQHLAVPRQSLVVGGDGSRLSAGAQILTGIEAERRGAAHRPGLTPPVLSLGE